MDENNFYQDHTDEVVNAENNYQQEAASNGANGFQIAGLVLGILSIVSGCCYGIPGLLFGIIGLILSIVGNKRGRNGVGTAALVCSIVGLVFGVLWSLFYFIGFASLIESGEFYDILENAGYYQ